jgi:hypothetical protein
MHVQMGIVAALVVALAGATAAPAQNAPVFQFTEKPGPFQVGLKVVEQYDYSRIYRHSTDALGKPYSGERARPLQTLVWYPAPEQMTIPLLYFAQGEITLEDQARYFTDPAKNEGPSVLNLWTHGDLVTVHMLGLVHVEHSSMYQRNEDVWKGFHDDHKGDYEREDGILGYAWITRYTLQFLDAYLKHEAAALAYLKRTPAENGAPKHFITVNYRAALGAPASSETFRSELGRQGFPHAADVYAAMRKEKSDFKLDEVVVNSWGYELMADSHLSEAMICSS